MPLIKSAKKKLKQDKVRTLRNKGVEKTYKELVKKAVKNPTEKTITLAFSAADKAAKHHIIHENKAARVKAKLSKLSNSKKTKATTTTPSLAA